jgi:hypothetical protein
VEDEIAAESGDSGRHQTYQARQAVASVTAECERYQHPDHRDQQRLGERPVTGKRSLISPEAIIV